MELVSLFELKLRRVAEEFEKVVIVKGCLDLPVANKEVLQPLFDQCSDLKTVWEQLTSVQSFVERFDIEPYSDFSAK